MPRRARTVPRRKPRQRRAEDTIVVLYDATERVVSKKGFHAATTNEIARVAGVSIGTLYHYFPTKESLVAAVVHRMWQAELDACMAHAAAFTEGPLEDAVRVTIEALAGVVRAKVPLYRAWYGEASHLGDLDAGLAMTDQAIDFLRAALEARRVRGLALRPHDLGFAADLVVKTAVAVVRTASRDWPAQLEDGTLARELSAMLTRYLLG
jgi:AcrR family transcriptional regulator